jgi:hypothetical protein
VVRKDHAEPGGLLTGVPATLKVNGGQVASGGPVPAPNVDGEPERLGQLRAGRPAALRMRTIQLTTSAAANHNARPDIAASTGE